MTVLNCKHFISSGSWSSKKCCASCHEDSGLNLVTIDLYYDVMSTTPIEMQVCCQLAAAYGACRITKKDIFNALEPLDE